jgi:hypothetical protein
MKILIALFPKWIVKQYNLKKSPKQIHLPQDATWYWGTPLD